MYGAQGEKAASSLPGRRRWRGGAVPEAPCDGDGTSWGQQRGKGNSVVRSSTNSVEGTVHCRRGLCSSIVSAPSVLDLRRTSRTY